MALFFHKPKLLFTFEHETIDDINHIYDKVDDMETLIMFVYYCLEACEHLEGNKNEDAKTVFEIYQSVGYPLYAFITNKSYESKIQI